MFQATFDSYNTLYIRYSNTLNNTTMVINFNELLRDIFCYIKSNKVKETKTYQFPRLYLVIFLFACNLGLEVNHKKRTHQLESLPTHEAYNGSIHNF